MYLGLKTFLDLDFNICTKIVVLVFIGLSSLSSYSAQDLVGLIKATLQNDLSIKSDHMQVRASNLEMQAAKKKYLPRLDFDGSALYTRFGDSNENIIGTIDYDLILTQSLYNESIQAEILHKKAKVEEFEFRQKHSVQLAIKATIDSYLHVIESKEHKQYVESQSQFIDKHVQIAKEKYRIGSVNIIEVQLAEARSASLQSDLIDANYSYEKSKTILEYISDVKINKLLQRPYIDLPPKYLKTNFKSLSLHPEAKIYQAQIKQQFALMAIEKTKMYPHLSAFASLELNHLEGRIPRQNIGLMLSYNIYHGRKDILKIESTKFSEKSMSFRYQRHLKDTSSLLAAKIIDYKNIREKITHLSKSVLYLQKILENRATQFNSGAIHGVTVLDAQERLLDAQTQLSSVKSLQIRMAVEILSILGHLNLTELKSLIKHKEIAGDYE